MTIDHCITVIHDPLIPIEEKGKKAVFRNPSRARHRKVRVDGCVMLEGIRSDYILANDKVGHLIVELKGRDVEKAIKQVVATARFWRKTHLEGKRLAGLVVSCRVPSIDTITQRAKDQFKKEFSGKLKFVGHNREHDLSEYF